MDTEPLAFLSGGADEPAPAPAAPEGPARGPDGRFAAHTPAEAVPTAQTEPEPTPEPTPTPSPPLTEKETVGFFKAMQAEREKRQALERELEGYRASQAPPPAPDPIASVQAELYRQKMEVSRGFADQRYGADTMSQVHDWAVARCDADPHFNEQVRQSANPYEFAKQAYDREQVLSAVKPDELTDYQAWKSARAAPQPTPFAHQPVPAPPRSLADMPNAGGAGRPELPMGPGAAFASAITR